MRTIAGILGGHSADSQSETGATQLVGRLSEHLSSLASRVAAYRGNGMVNVALARVNAAVRLASTYVQKGRAGVPGAWGRAEHLLRDAMGACDELDQLLEELDGAAAATGPGAALRRVAFAILADGGNSSVSSLLEAAGATHMPVVRAELERAAGALGLGLELWWASPERTIGERLLAVDRAIWAVSKEA